MSTTHTPPYFTIDTDNAIIRLYTDRAIAGGLTAAGVIQLRRDLTTVAAGVSDVTGARFRVVAE